MPLTAYVYWPVTWLPSLRPGVQPGRFRHGMICKQHVTVLVEASIYLLYFGILRFDC